MDLLRYSFNTALFCFQVEERSLFYNGCKWCCKSKIFASLNKPGKKWPCKWKCLEPEGFYSALHSQMFLKRDSSVARPASESHLQSLLFHALQFINLWQTEILRSCSFTSYNKRCPFRDGVYLLSLTLVAQLLQVVCCPLELPKKGNYCSGFHMALPYTQILPFSPWHGGLVEEVT